MASKSTMAKHLQSSQVRCAFWQWKHARFAFFFFGPSRVLVCEPASPLSVESPVRLRLAVCFLAEPGGTGVLFSELEEEEDGRDG